MSTQDSRSITSLDELPSNPPRDNYAYGCDELDEPVQDRQHVHECECDTHHGVCQECGYKITIGPSGREYGHARANNRGPDPDGVRRDCPHRPLQCNSGEPQAWEGYDPAEWNATRPANGGEGA